MMKCPKCGGRVQEEQFDTSIVWACAKCSICFSDTGLEGKSDNEILDAWMKKCKNRRKA
jgi:hypothetical protein